MKSCGYCGRENDDAAVRCTECGTEIETPQSVPDPKHKSLLRRPSGLVWLFAFIIVLQGIIRLASTPYDPSLGEGDYKRVEAASYLWSSLGVGTILFAIGFYLRSREKDENVV